MKEIVKSLKSCLHCECISIGFLIPRPLGEAVHGLFIHGQLVQRVSIHSCIKRRLVKLLKIKNVQSARKGEPLNFGLGDYFPVAIKIHKQVSKLIARWRGPQKIVKVPCNWVFEVQDLLSGDITTLHSARLKYYANYSFDRDSEILNLISRDGASFEVIKFLELRQSSNSKDYDI